MNFRILIAAALVAVGLAGVADAQTRPGQPKSAAAGSPAEQTKAYLETAKAQMIQRGFVRCRAPWVKAVPRGGNDVYSAAMTAGKACEVAARCDNDCSDVDVFISNPKGAAVGQAVGLTDEEHLAFVPPSSGKYKFKMEMPGCKGQNSCSGGLILCCQR